jgi:hypothetical protein
MRLILQLTSLFGLLFLILGKVLKDLYGSGFVVFSKFLNMNISTLFADLQGKDHKGSGYQRRWSVSFSTPDSDNLWERCKCKGCKVMGQISYSDFDVGLGASTSAEHCSESMVRW